MVTTRTPVTCKLISKHKLSDIQFKSSLLDTHLCIYIIVEKNIFFFSIKYINAYQVVMI